jgi:hypothetical protein
MTRLLIYLIGYSSCHLCLKDTWWSTWNSSKCSMHFELISPTSFKTMHHMLSSDYQMFFQIQHFKKVFFFFSLPPSHSSFLK